MSPDVAGRARRAAARRGGRAPPGRRRAGRAPAAPRRSPPLLLAVGDDSWAVRQAAIEALACFRARRAAAGAGGGAARRRGRRAAQRGDGDLRPARLGRGAAAARAAARPRRGGAPLRGGDARHAQGAERRARRWSTALSDADVNVRHAAATSLGQIGSNEAVPRLVEALREEPWLQYPALHALGEIGDPRAAPALVPLLERRAAARRRRSRRSAAWAAATAWRAIAPLPARPRPRAAQRGDPRGGRDRAARHQLGRQPRPAGAGGAARRGPRHPPARRCCRTTTRATAAPPPITLGWLREPRATGAPDRAAGRRAGARVREPRAGLDRLPRRRGLADRPRAPGRRGAAGRRALPVLDRAPEPGPSWWRR